MMSSVLTGTPIGTPGSYRNHGTTIANVFDGNLTTFFDAPDASGDWVGLKLTTPSTIAAIEYAPRPAWEFRMKQGAFQASNSASFSAGVVNLFTVTAQPVANVFTTQAITNPATFSYVRYVGPTNAYCDIAELKFLGSAASTTPPPPPKLTGTPFGTGSLNANSSNSVPAAFDSSLTTFFDGSSANGNAVGEQFASEALIIQIQYAPRANFASRMVGGIFQGCNNPNFVLGVTNLYTITAAPAAGVYTSVPISGTTDYEYIRYLSPAGSYGDVAEIAVYGSLTGTQPAIFHPSVTNSSPANNATGVSTTAFVSCAVNLPNSGAGVVPGTLTSSSVYLYRTFDHSMIPVQLNTDAAGSDIVLQPQNPLDPNTNYTFVVTPGVTDEIGASFSPYQICFTTGTQSPPTDPNIAFQKVALPTATGQEFTCVTTGPDGNLYASTLTGSIFQFPMNADGTLGTPVNLTTNQPSRLITGIAFDPASNASNMTLWISSGSPIINNAPNWTGTISAITITGHTASAEVNYVIGLPRSNSNHLNEQPVFGPDGALYWSQGSMTSMGAPDSVWGFRTETLLSSAILRLNVKLVEQYVATNHQPLNVQTDSLPAGQAAYNPNGAGAPLTLYVTGIRNAFDLIWDTNGHLYVPTNGSSAGGNIPATPPGVTPAAPGETGVAAAEDDFLNDVTPGHYYGHPNPTRGEWIFGGANPINPPANRNIQTAYPRGTNPDPRYPGYAYDFGLHYSPDGAIEYVGNAFGGALNGALLITEYSGGKDIVVLRTGAAGQITQSEKGITGLTGYADPLDITENIATGNLYVVDLGAGSITLLRPIQSGATATTNSSNLYFNAPGSPTNSSAGASVSPPQAVTITNTGTQPLAIPATGLSILGSDGPLFIISSKPALPAIIAPGGSISLSIVFSPGATGVGLHTAQLEIASNDLVNPYLIVNLSALTTAGSTAPSLQSILNLFQIPDNVSSAEVPMQQLEKAGTGPVTITPLSVFSANITPSAGIGFYTVGNSAAATTLFTVNAASSQTVNPVAVGSTSFDPGTSVFGMFGSFGAFADPVTGAARMSFSEDALNAFDVINPHKIEFFPLTTAAGAVVPGAFVFAIEDMAAAPYNYNAVVGIIRNVQAAPATPRTAVANVDVNDAKSAFSPTRFAFSSIASISG